jgi:hypothetical protein
LRLIDRRRCGFLLPVLLLVLVLLPVLLVVVPDLEPV